MPDIEQNPLYNENISGDIKTVCENLKNLCGQSDLLVKEFKIGGVNIALVVCDGMTDNLYITQSINTVLDSFKDDRFKNSGECIGAVNSRALLSSQTESINTFAELLTRIYSGFCVLLFEGASQALVFNAVGYKTRGISVPTADVNVNGAKEGFIESAQINMTMIRRRIKSPALRFETLSLGKESKTSCCLIYLNNIVSPKLLQSVREKLERKELDIILSDGSARLLLAEKPFSLFSEVGSTDRPDTVCSKIYEGKVAVLIDGSPFALIVPFTFAEHFINLDDYSYKALYVNLLRIIKYSAFFIAVLLPGFYVAVCTFHPEIVPPTLLFTITSSEVALPFSLVTEALMILFIYEILRESGLRLPKEIGHAVSIVGALVIGDATVRAGIIGAPMVLVAALSVISAFIVPQFMDSVVLLRFGFILLGGFMGLFGIALGVAFVILNICAKDNFGLPFSSAISPVSRGSFLNIFFKGRRQGYGSADIPKVQELPGSDIE